MNVTIAVVSYNVRSLLERCLASARAELDGTQGRLVVVDNASRDGSPDVVRAQFPEAHLIANTENAGFGVACNQALAEAEPGGAVLFLNPDAELRPGALAVLTRRLQDLPACALVGPKVTYPDGRAQPTRRRFPRLRDLFLEGTPLEWRGVARPLLAQYYCDGAPEVAGRVDWLSGACLLGRVDALRAVGGFDPSFFMYFEEVDLSRRLAAYGWQTWYEPNAQVTHHSSRSADQDLTAKDRRYYASKYRYAERYFGRSTARALRLWSTGMFATERALQRRRGDAALVRRYEALVKWHLSPE
jgi:N-acetylglucosaminyl-diphospho-decaprenol L-rhamnosyltransferase